MNRLPIAVIGAGAIGRNHIELISRHQHCVLAAIVDPDPAAAGLAAQYGIPHLHEIDEGLLAAGARAAIVATPTSLHGEHAAATIQLGLAILIEKPVTATVAEALALEKQAKSSNVPVLVGHHRRHSAVIAAAREAILAGTVGTVTAATAHFLIGKPDSYFGREWRRNAGSGGPVLTNLIHDIDCMRYLLGEVRLVFAMTSPSRRGHAVEDTAGVLLTFENGAIGTLIASDTTPGPFSWEFTSGEDARYHSENAPCYVISGTKGTLELPSLRLWQQTSAVDWHLPLESRRLPATRSDPLERQLTHFIDVAMGKCAASVTISDALGTLVVIEAIGRATIARSIVPIGDLS